MREILYIGSTEINLEANSKIIISEELKPFKNQLFPIERAIFYNIHFQREVKPFSFKALTTVPYPSQIIGISDMGECRIYNNDKGNKLPKAIYQELKEEGNKSYRRITLFEEITESLIINLDFLSYLALERQLILSETMILHSAFIIDNEEAILFTAPSGTGKSTQGDLWNKYRDSEIINGDRSLLIKQDNLWYASGFPLSGSSGISKNKKAPIKAIVALRQDKVDSGSYQIGINSFKRIYPEIILNYWNKEYEQKVYSLLGDLLTTVPVIDYGCTISSSAVITLNNLLNNENSK